MKVVMIKNVSGIGRAGEIAEVADGYARNFLIPRRLAVPANAKSVQEARETRDSEARAAIEARHLAQMHVLKLRSLVLEFKEKTARSGVFYAAVNAHKVVDALREIGVIVTRADVAMPSPIKQPGESVVKVSLGHGIVVDVHCRVTAA